MSETARVGRPVDVALCTFAILALELGLIRWIGGQIRIVAYFSNLILLAAFLGMGLGIALGRRRPALAHVALPALAILSGVLAFSRELRIMSVRFPDPTIFLWGADARPTTLWQFLVIVALVAAIFWCVAAIFAFAAVPLGKLFSEIAPLRAYTADVFGSLAGIVAMTLVSAEGASPWVWMALGALPLLRFSRSVISIASALVVVVLAAASEQGAFFSPYNRIDIEPLGAPYQAHDSLRREWELSVNRDYHQRILDLSP